MMLAGRKLLTVAQLKEVLKDIPDDMLLHPNSVGNLTVATRHQMCEPNYVGYIDFVGEGEYKGHGS